MPTFPENILSIADDNGTISFYMAARTAAAHGPDAADHFWKEYSRIAGERVDAGEFLVSLGY